ncbi:MAG TPA: DUF1800 family protein [Arachnia sp.]|nr:DUF1800 family protein [Arachnia sp.]
MYLSNNESDAKGVNENYGRELLELHTVGLPSGFTEADVAASAAILSGRGFNNKTQEFAYDPTSASAADCWRRSGAE